MFVAIINFLRSWRRYNASLTELNQLGDRELADIGISRSDIPRVAWGTANRYGVPPRHPMKAPAPCGRFRFLASRDRYVPCWRLRAPVAPRRAPNSRLGQKQTMPPGGDHPNFGPMIDYALQAVHI